MYTTIITASFLNFCLCKKTTRNYKLISTQRQSKDGATNKYFIFRLPSFLWLKVPPHCKMFLLKSENSCTASNTRKVRTVLSLTPIFIYSAEIH